MNINGVIISEEKLNRLTSIISEEVYRDEYIVAGYNDIEISRKYGLTARDASRLRTIYNIPAREKYRLTRNPLRKVFLSNYQKDFLHGSLFGDSCISVQESGTGYWQCRHCIQQEKFLLKKAEIMKPFTAKVSYGERSFVKGGKEFPYITARSYALQQFTEYRKKFYPEGRKSLTETLLCELSPVGFSYWWMDDGCAEQYGFSIVSYDRFFINQKRKVTEIFRDIHGLSVSITENAVKEIHIRVLKESRDIAYEYVKDQISTDMIYKLPKRYRSEDNQQPSFDGNIIEGSTTEGSLISYKDNGDKTCFDRAICQSTPSTCIKTGSDTV